MKTIFPRKYIVFIILAASAALGACSATSSSNSDISVSNVTTENNGSYAWIVLIKDVQGSATVSAVSAVTLSSNGTTPKDIYANVDTGALTEDKRKILVSDLGFKDDGTMFMTSVGNSHYIRILVSSLDKGTQTLAITVTLTDGSQRSATAIQNFDAPVSR